MWLIFFPVAFSQVFVKGRRADFMAHPEEALHWGSQVFPSEQDFQLMTRSYLINNMGTNLLKDENLMDLLWFPPNGPTNFVNHPGTYLKDFVENEFTHLEKSMSLLSFEPCVRLKAFD